MAHAPSTASSNPGRRHIELLLIQPLLNNVSSSAGTITVYCYSHKHKIYKYTQKSQSESRGVTDTYCHVPVHADRLLQLDVAG